MTNTIKNILLSNEANKILLEFNSNLDYTNSAIELADFSISINDAAGVIPTGGQFTGTNANDVWLSLTTGTVLAGDKVQVTYTADGGNTGKLITAAVPPQAPQDLDFSGGNSGQHYISNGVSQNVAGTTVSLGFPSNTIDAPSNAALTAANNFKVQYSVMEGGNALTKTIDASSAAWNSTNNAIDLTMPSLGNYAASATSVDINHLTQVRFAPTSAAEALQEFGGGNPIFSAVSDKNAPMTFGDFNDVSNFIVNGGAAEGTTGEIHIEATGPLTLAGSDIVEATGDFSVTSYAGGQAIAVPLVEITTGTSGGLSRIVLDATFAQPIPNDSPVFVEYIKDATPDIKLASTPAIAPADVPNDTETVNSIQLAGGSSGGTSAQVGDSILSLTKVDNTTIDVKFKHDLVKVDATLESGDFTVTGNTVSAAAFKNGVSDTVTLTTGSALASTGTVPVKYDGAEVNAAVKLQFVGASTTQTVQAASADPTSSGASSLVLNIAPSGGLTVNGTTVSVKFTGPVTGVDTADLADFDVYYKDDQGDADPTNDTIETITPTAVVINGTHNDTVDLTLSGANAGKVTDTSIAGFEFYGPSGATATNQLTIGTTATTVAADVRGHSDGDIKHVGTVRDDTGTLKLDVEFVADINTVGTGAGETKLDASHFQVTTGNDFGLLDNNGATGSGAPSTATVSAVDVGTGASANKVTLTLSAGAFEYEYATVDYTGSAGAGIELASYTKTVQGASTDVSTATKNLDLSGGGGGGGGAATATGDIQSLTKVDSTHLDVKFNAPLNTSNPHSLEKEDFTVTNNSVDAAAFKNGVSDTVTLTLGTPLGSTGTLNLTYDPDSSGGTHAGGLQKVTGTTDTTAVASTGVADVRDGYATNVEVGTGGNADKIIMKFQNAVSSETTTLDPQDFLMTVVDMNNTPSDASDDTITVSPSTGAPTIAGGDVILGAPAGVTDLTSIVGVEFQGSSSSGANADSILKVGSNPASATAEVLNGLDTGDFASVGEVQQAGAVKTVEVTFKHDLADGATPQPADFSIQTTSSLSTINSAGATAALAVAGTNNNQVLLTIDGATDTDAALTDYVKVTYSGSGLDLKTPTVTNTSDSTASLSLSGGGGGAVTPTLSFTDGTAVGLGTDADNAFHLATGAIDGSADKGADDYTAFGGAGNDSAIAIDGGDVFIGGAGVDTAKLLHKFQDYDFKDVSAGDTTYDNMVSLSLTHGATEAGKTAGEIATLQTSLLNAGAEPEASDAVQLGGDPGAPGAATKTNWLVTSETVMDSSSIIQSENIEFMAGPQIDINNSISTSALAEKTNIASDFKEHDVTVDLTNGTFAGHQTLFWQIDAPGGAGKASSEDFLHTTGYVDIAPTDTSKTFKIKVRNDGDKDEAEENFDIKIGYVIGDNKAESVTIGIGEASTPTDKTDFSTTAGSVVIDVDQASTAVNTFDTNPADAVITTAGGATTFALTSTYSGSAAASDQVVTSLTVGTPENLNALKADNESLKVLVTDTAGNKVDIGHTVLQGAGNAQTVAITASDLAYAASSENYFLQQATISGTIEADPLEWYVYNGWATTSTATKTFVGKDLAGNEVRKDVKGDGTSGVNTFTSIQNAIDHITTETGLRIRVAEDHVESAAVNVNEDNLRIEFWDIDGVEAATDTTIFNLYEDTTLAASVKNLTLGGSRDAIINGNKWDNKIVGTDGVNIIRGKAGNDEIVAKGGNDTVYAGSGNDFVDGGAGSDKVFGNQGNDILQASEDAFKLPTGATDHTSNDFISGGSGDDVLIDLSNKTSGEVIMLGGSGIDKITTAADRNGLDFGSRTVLPFDKQTTTSKKINMKVVDFSHKDGLDVNVLEGSAAAADTGLTGRDGTVGKLFLIGDLAGQAPIDLTTSTNATNATNSRVTKANGSDNTVVDLGTGNTYSMGLVVPGVAVGDAAPPILKVEGQIELAHINDTHLVASKANLGSGGPLETAATAQDAFDSHDFNLDGTADQIIFLPTTV